jgi:hypothetical protein
VVLILGALAITAAAAVAAIVLTRSAEKTQLPVSNAPLGNLVIDDSNVEDIKAQVEEKVSRGMFETHMNTVWNFPDGKSASTDAVMGNSANNRFPFWFEVKADDDIVYTSSLLPVGSQVKEIKLLKNLSKGSYNATVYVHMVDENGEPVDSSVGFSVTLNIKN